MNSNNSYVVSYVIRTEGAFYIYEALPNLVPFIILKNVKIAYGRVLLLESRMF